MRSVNRMTATFLAAILSVVLNACGGGGGGEAQFVPTLPANATRITAGAVADSVISEVFDSFDSLSTVTAFKSGSQTASPGAILRRATGAVKNASLGVTGTAGRTEVQNCDPSTPQGSIRLDFDETASTADGKAIFDNCVIFGAVIDGTILFHLSFDSGSGNYSDDFNGSISIAFGGETVTMVFDMIENGNEISGDYSGTTSFSISSSLGGGFLVTTTGSLSGNSLTGDVYSGTLIVSGADNTRLRIQIIALNTADIDIDDGSGTFSDYKTLML